MKHVLTMVIFLLMLSGIGAPLITLVFLLIGYVSQEQNVRYLELDWFYHLGFFVFIVLLLRIMFKVSRRFSTFLLSLFSSK